MAKEKSSRSPTESDVEVGRRVRSYRNDIGLSQAKLAQQIGVTIRQVQKYEGGLNRIGITRLQLIAQALGVTIEHFVARASGAGDPRSLLSRFLDLPEAEDLMRAFLQIVDGADRQRGIGFIEALGPKKPPR